MKTTLPLTVGILVVGFAPGLFQQKQLSDLRADHQSLVRKAARYGIAVETPGSSQGPRATKRQREEIEKQTKATSSEVIRFARDLEEMRKNGGKPDSDFQARSMEVLARLAELDSSQISAFIKILRDEPGLSASTRGSLIAYSILTLADQNPEAAITLYAEASDLLDGKLLGSQIVSASIGNLAQTDPDRALEWIRKNAGKFGDDDADEMKRALLAGAALNSPDRAFKLIGELGFEDRSEAISAIIASGSENQGQRGALLTGLRGYLAGIQDAELRDEISANAMETFARSSEKEGFDSITTWMEEQKFTEKEKLQFSAGLSWFTTKQDTGRWVEWMGNNLPADEATDPVREVVGEWTQQDYVAAGEWLGKAQDGPVKSAAVQAYASAVAEYEPRIAVQWALTIPPGPIRDDTLRDIYANWPSKDPEGAAAFAREHNLE